jgi:hypothetical protein
MEFPEEFNINIYRDKNKDLTFMTDTEIIQHYHDHGKKEGRICCKVENRNFIHEYLAFFKSCLEIGPFDCPVLKGNNVEYFDVLDQKGLYDRAVRIHRTNHLHDIPFIHYVSAEADLSVIPKKFNMVLSCHSIEHQIDFLQHLKDVFNLLDDGGVYVIILPDKRYCFDHFLRETTIADVLHYHLSKTKFHTVKSVIEHRAMTCHGDYWNNPPLSKKAEAGVVAAAIQEYEDCMKRGEYLDVHSLQFTPDSMKTIIDLLSELGYVDFTVDKVYPTLHGSVEFFVVLRKIPR